MGASVKNASEQQAERELDSSSIGSRTNASELSSDLVTSARSGGVDSGSQLDANQASEALRRVVVDVPASTPALIVGDVSSDANKTAESTESILSVDDSEPH